MEATRDNINKISEPKLKRLFDIIFSLLLLIIAAPLFILILLAIYIEHILGGNFFASFFYIEKRVSAGQPFDFIKFNIFKPEIIKQMKKEKEFIHTKILEHDNKSLGAVGKFVQKMYLDELPQLINVLKGDLSMVGPRPVNIVNYKRILEKGITTKAEIKAGLAGNYQAHKGESGADQDKLDREYINFCKNHSDWKIVLFDIKILLRTLLIIFRAEGI